jgi:5-methylcytosine-specific restriction endonuclease McrA
MARPRRSYAQYLGSNRWAQTRARAIRRARGKCQLCGRPWGLEVHHRPDGYRNLGHEAGYMLCVLCDSCHGAFHERQEAARAEDRAR